MQNVRVNNLIKQDISDATYLSSQSKSVAGARFQFASPERRQDPAREEPPSFAAATNGQVPDTVTQRDTRGGPNLARLRADSTQ